MINLLTNISLPILTSLSGGTETSIVHCPLNESSKYAIHCRIFPRKRSRQCSEATSSGRSFSRLSSGYLRQGEVLTGKSGVGNTHWLPAVGPPGTDHWSPLATRVSHTCLPGTAVHCLTSQRRCYATILGAHCSVLRLDRIDSVQRNMISLLLSFSSSFELSISF